MKSLWKTAMPVVVSAFLVVGLNSALRSAPSPQQNAKSASETDTSIPAPRVAGKGQQTATFAAGCFWSMEAIFQQLEGVASVEPGYGGGQLKNPSYNAVLTGETGHAESVNIIYDPKKVSYRDLLEVLLTLRNPTTPNQQGPDVGTQYRFVIFARGVAQEREAKAVVAEFEKKKVWGAPIVAQVVPFSNFYRAEEYHVNYFKKNPGTSYCAAMISPKLEELKKKFPSKVK